MDSFVKFTNQSQGRDRLFRATQYACMLLRYLLENKAGKEKLVLKLKRVESNMSSGRKLFRLGNVVHAIEASKKAVDLSDAFSCYCLTAANLNRVIYFTCDTILWVRSVGLVSNINKEKWRHRATRYYFYSLLLNIAVDFYVVLRGIKKVAKHVKHMDTDADMERRPDTKLNFLLPTGLGDFLFMLYLSLKNNPPVLLDIIKNTCDLFSPLDRLEIYQTNQGLIGISGLISSIVGILTVAKPPLKLKH
ncbi:peroxisomal membrane protein 11A [Bombina bombina]|uniref:peroxisomal membrane protein 11A n=1 Tax=Bombina bombina TaxID=8345 RepID=UPI00235AB47F|nr:peroxisomal membrane protein 11A [Bombina bombina]